MSDLISRQAVINAIANTCFWLSGSDWNELIECIDSIPSVENKGEWIPVSERLPKVADCYAVTRQIGSDLIVDACFFDGTNTWHNDNRINHERNYLTNIVAWQPLPEPYQKGGE